MKWSSSACVVVLGFTWSSASGQEAADPDARRDPLPKSVQREIDLRDAKIANLKAALAEEQARSAELNVIRKTERDEYRERIDEVLAEYTKYRAESREQVESLHEMLTTSHRTLDRLAARALELERWQVDARLESFDPKTGRGVVALGSRHGVRRRLRFHVGRPTEERKTVPIVEVVRILGPDSCEVRLLPGDEKREPADLESLVGANLHAPWWRAGETTEVAIVGRFQTDDDSTPDGRRPWLGTFLRLQGAEVVVSLGRFDTKVDGELTDDTRLVIRGDTDAAPVILDENTKRHLSAAADLVSEARRRGIPVLTEQEFLAHTGGPPLPLSEEDLEVLREKKVRELLRKLEEREAAPTAAD